MGLSDRRQLKPLAAKGPALLREAAPSQDTPGAAGPGDSLHNSQESSILSKKEADELPRPAPNTGCPLTGPWGADSEGPQVGLDGCVAATLPACTEEESRSGEVRRKAAEQSR